MPAKKRTVLVFGVFDGLHEGHQFFLNEARKLGEQLVAVVATDTVVMGLKKHPAVFPLAERLKVLRESGLVDEAAPGDTELRSWSAVETYRPDIIALGYDQTQLEKELRTYIRNENLPVQIVKIPALNPDRLHSSLLRHK